MHAIIFLFGIIALQSSHLHAEVRQGKAVVFDAGSTGTRVFIYDWSQKVAHSLVDINLPAGRTKKIEGGLTSFGQHIPKISGYLNQLIKFAKKIVGEENIKTTPLFFAATAGLRLEQQRNPEGYAKIMAKIKEVLEGSGFVIADEPRAISGQEEAAFAWVDVNALEHRLPKILAGQDLGIGIVEMGGASFQIAFLPEAKPQSQAFPINLANKILTLYAYSYGDLGENEARRLLVNKEYCEWGHDNNKAGNFDKCREAILAKILSLKGKECDSCGIGPIFQPRLAELTQKFYGVGSLGFLIENFGIHTINARNLKKAGDNICNVTFKEAVTKVPTLRNKKDLLKKQCFNLAYFSAVLTGHEKIGDNALGFPGNTTRLIAKRDINHQEVSWTLGYLMLSIDKFLNHKHLSLRQTKDALISGEFKKSNNKL
jgi:apyrase